MTDDGRAMLRFPAAPAARAPARRGRGARRRRGGRRRRRAPLRARRAPRQRARAARPRRRVPRRGRGGTRPPRAARRVRRGRGAPLPARDALRVRPRPRRGRGAVAVDRVRAQLERLLRRAPRGAAPTAAGPRVPDPRPPPTSRPRSPRRALVAFPDRVARRRRPDGNELLLAGGGTATLADGERRARRRVRRRGGRRGAPAGRPARAHRRRRHRPEGLLEAFPARVREEVVARFVADGERVEAVRRTVYEGLALEEVRVPASATPRGRRRCSRPRRGAPAWARSPTTAPSTRCSRGRPSPRRTRPASGSRRSTRRRRAARSRPSARAARRSPSCAPPTSWARSSARLPSAARARARGARAGTGVRLHGGWSRRASTYAAGRPPFVEAPLQDCFGQTDGPRVAGGRVPVTLHLLAPNRRPVQVTTDLAGFWDRHYEGVRREALAPLPAPRLARRPADGDPADARPAPALTPAVPPRAPGP